MLDLIVGQIPIDEPANAVPEPLLRNSRWNDDMVHPAELKLAEDGFRQICERTLGNLGSVFSKTFSYQVNAALWIQTAGANIRARKIFVSIHVSVSCGTDTVKDSPS